MMQPADDDWYQRHVPLSDRIVAVVPDAGSSPEDLLMAAEEEAGISAYARGKGVRPRKTVRQRREAHEKRGALKKLAVQHREALLLSLGCGANAVEIARVQDVTKQAVHKRLDLAERRLRWIAGPGSLFTARDVHNEFTGVLEDADRDLLRVYWRLRWLPEAADALRMSRAKAFRRMRAILTGSLPRLVEADPERYGRFQEGFAALRETSRGAAGLFQSTYLRPKVPRVAKNDAVAGGR